MTLSGPRFFDESNSNAWRFAALIALLLGVQGLNISVQFSLINLGISLLAVVASLSLTVPFRCPNRLPTGTLAGWIILLAGVWLSPLATLPPDYQRVVFAVTCVFIGLAFQGRMVTYFSLLGIALGLLLPTLCGDLGGQSFGVNFRDVSFWILQGGIGLSISLLFVRIAHSRSEEFLKTLRTEREKLERTRGQVSTLLDSVGAAREKLLGRSSGEAEISSGISRGDGLPSGLEIESRVAAFDELVSALRLSLTRFQVRGRQAGRINGPIRFVFFPPAAGYDEKSMIAVELPSVLSGIDACLELALDSLPESGARRREGAIRLSIRYGLRVIEIAVEDNGRGLELRNPTLESALSLLRESTHGWGGKFDRIARLGVGSRTSLELRIVRERSRLYRPTLKHVGPVDPQFEVAPRG